MEKTKEELNRIFGEKCHEMERCIEEVFCPFCGVTNGFIKTNGNGYYRCKGKCKRKFFLVFEEKEE